MTKEQYDKALMGFRMNPQRHYEIDGRQPNTIEQLNQLAKDFGFNPETGSTAKAVQTSAQPQPAANPAARPAPARPSTVAPPKQAAAKAAKPADAPPVQSEPKVDEPKLEETEGEEHEEEVESGEHDEAEESNTPNPNLAAGAGSHVDLLKMKFNDLRKLAKEIGCDPVPNTQDALIAAIIAKREGP